MQRVAEGIGYLVYAVASADKKVRPAEKQIIHDYINENWKLLADNEDPFGVRALDYIDKIVTKFEEHQIESEDAIQAFKVLFQDNKELFTPQIKHFIIDLCIKTGSAFNRMNKHELVLMSRIENLLR